MKKSIFALVLSAMMLLCVLPASAAIGTIVGSHDVTQTVVDNSITQQAGVVNTANVYAPNTVNNYNTIKTNGVYNLDTGTVEFNRVLMADQVIVLPIQRFGSNATLYQITAATPIAVWTIDSNGYTAAKTEETRLTYDPIYDKMDHGMISPIDVVPYFTTKCTITPSYEAKYLVVDNRYYPVDAVTQIRFGDSGIPLE